MLEIMIVLACGDIGTDAKGCDGAAFIGVQLFIVVTVVVVVVVVVAAAIVVVRVVVILDSGWHRVWLHADLVEGVVAVKVIVVVAEELFKTVVLVVAVEVVEEVVVVVVVTVVLVLGRVEFVARHLTGWFDCSGLNTRFGWDGMVCCICI